MDHFRQALPELTDKKQVIFDLSAVPFIDSAGLGAIIGAIRRVRENGGEAVVCAPKRSVCRVMQIVGLIGSWPSSITSPAGSSTLS